MSVGILFGASGHGKVVLEVARAVGLTIAAVYDDAPSVELLLGVPVLKASDLALKGLGPFRFLASIGDNRSRKKVFERLLEHGGEPLTLVHPSAVVSPSAKVGAGTVICAEGVLIVDAHIGENCIINTGASVDHDGHIGSYVHLCPGVRLAGNVTVGDGTMIGTGAIVIPGVKVGPWSVIGAGSVVVKDIPSGVVAYGNPASVVRPCTDRGSEYGSDENDEPQRTRRRANGGR